MSERLRGRRTDGQLSLPIRWWQSFDSDPKTLATEHTIDELATSHEHLTTDANKLAIQRLQIDLARRALNFYGVNKIGKVGNFGNGYEFDFQYSNRLVSTTWHNHKSLSVVTWQKGMNKADRMSVWGAYREKIKSMTDQDEPDPTLIDLCKKHQHEVFSVRATIDDPHIRTRHALPAVLHILDMPIDESLPIVGPGQDGIEVIEPGKIVSQRDGWDTVWSMNDQGIFEKV